MLNDLLEQYWEAGFDEANKDRDHDTIDGLAQRTLAAIHAEVQRLIAAEREACAKMADAVSDCGPDNGCCPTYWNEAVDACVLAIREMPNKPS